MDDLSRRTVLVETGAQEAKEAPMLVPGPGGVLVPETPATVPAKRGRGRPKGLGRAPGSGRKKGTRNKDRMVSIERIQREADPIGLLAKIARGDRMTGAPAPGETKKTWWYPSGEQRLQAATVLARKVTPDVKAIEVAGTDGGPVAITILDFLKGLPE